MSARQMGAVTFWFCDGRRPARDKENLRQPPHQPLSRDLERAQHLLGILFVLLLTFEAKQTARKACHSVCPDIHSKVSDN
jgi:hypothetical protein